MATFNFQRLDDDASMEEVIDTFNELVDKLNYTLNNLDDENIIGDDN